MGKILIPGSSGGGVTSEDVTASKAQVLKGYKTVTTDSDDEVVDGEIVNRGNIVDTSGFENAYWDSKYLARMEQGFYSQNGQWKPCVAIPYAVMASVAGVDANKMLDSLTIAGIRGTVHTYGAWNNALEVVNATWENKVHVRFEEGYYPKDGNYKPAAIVPYDVLANAIGIDASKMLSALNVLGKQGQIKSINTQDNNYRVNKSTAFGIDNWTDPNNVVFYVDFPHGNGYYNRPDGHPHVCIDAANLGTAGADSVLSGQTATSVQGVKFAGAIQRWICTTGDVITALGGEGFAWDDTHANRGRGIVVRIPNGYYIQGANWAFLPSPNHLPHNIRKNVNINGTIGTMEDYGAGRVAFRNATFDNVLMSGVANIGLGSSLLSYTRPATEIRDGIIRFSNTSSASGGGLHEYRKDRVLEESVTLAHSVNLTPFRTIRLGLKYPYGGKWGTVGGVGALVGVVWALPTGLPANYIPSINSKINASVIKKVGYKDGVVPMTSGQWNTLVAIPNGAEYFVDVDVSELQGHHRIAVGIAVSSPNRQEATIQVNVVVNNSISGISHIEFIN